MPIPPRDNCDCVDKTIILDSDGDELEINPDGSINVDTVVNVVGPVDVNVLNEVEIKNDAGDPITVDGTVCIDDCGNSITVDDGGLSLTVDGTVDIGNFPASVEVSNDVGNPLPISKNTTVNSVTNPVFTQLTDGVIAADIQNAGAATGALMVQLAGDAQIVDASAWMAFSDMFVMVGGIFSGSTLGGAAAIRTNTRAWLVEWVNASGIAYGTNTNPVQIGDAGGSITVDGTVAVSNFPASVEVSNDVGNPLPISDGGGSITVDGTVSVGNFPASVEVSNDVGNPLPISGTTAANALANPIWTRLSDGTTAVDIQNSGAATGAMMAQLAGNAQMVDVSTWTQFVDMFVMVGGLVSGSNFGGVAAIRANTRAWLIEWVNSAGAEMGTNANPVQIGDAGGSITVDDGGGSITVDGTVTSITPAAPTTVSQASVAASASSVQLLASNTAREMATFFNDSIATCYLKMGTTASTSSFHVRIPGGGYYELPLTRNGVYTGRIDGIWTAATGNMRIGETT